MAHANHAKAQVEKEGKVVRNDERKQANALKVTREVTKGKNVLNTNEQYGHAKLVTLSLPVLTALLTNADPQGNKTKAKNIAEAMLRVYALSFAPVALSKFALAVAYVVALPTISLAPTPAPTSLPPSTSNFSSFGRSYRSYFPFLRLKRVI